MFWIIAFISPVSISPFSIAGNTIATYGRPEAGLFAPQGIGQNLAFEFTYSADFGGYLHKYYLGIQYRGFALSWLSSSVDEFSENTFSIAKAIKNFGVALSIAPEVEKDDNDNLVQKWYYGFGLGVMKVLAPIWVSATVYYGNGYIGGKPFGYHITYDRTYGVLSLMYPARGYTVYLDAFMEKGYPLAVRAGFLMKVHERVNLFMGYDSGSSAFNAGIVVSSNRLMAGYKFTSHPVLGAGNAGSILIRR